MEYEFCKKLKKGDEKVFRMLIENELRRAWFVCYHITKDTETAAPLLIAAWNRSLTECLEAEKPPKCSFRELFAENLARSYLRKPESDSDYKGINIPGISSVYRPFLDAIDALRYEDRYMYLLHVFCGLSMARFADIIHVSVEEAQQKLDLLSEDLTANSGITKQNYAQFVMLSTKLKSSDNRIFRDIKLPDILLNRIYHDYRHMLSDSEPRPAGNKPVRKDLPTMNKKQFKKKKLIAAIVIILLAVIAIIVILPRITAQSSSSSIVTTYNVDEITYGNVSSTISGSGTLTPVTSETLTASRAAEVTSVNYNAGDEVASGDVIAVLTAGNGSTEEITASFDGVIIEIPINAGDDISQGGEVAMVMGKDGYTLGIAVDELDIATVALDQEVDITIDAVSGDYTGSVSDISYNGSTSGSVTAYEITVSVDYIEGVYPGMSVSAEIVVEDSGDGLIVPVDAVSTSGDDSYIYLAPDSAETGDEYEEDELDLSDLTTVTVETGMSDGSYIMIESDELEEGDLIVITTVTSTQTGSDSSSSEDMSGMDFSDFDFEDFDPSSMPQGGGDFSGSFSE